MKPAKYSALVAFAAIALSLCAFAKDGHSGDFTVSDKVQVGSTQLAPGDYKAEWTGPADNVKIVITQHGKTVATTEGKVTTLQQPSPYTAVLTKKSNDNTVMLDRIEFSHRSEVLQLGGE